MLSSSARPIWKKKISPTIVWGHKSPAMSSAPDATVMVQENTTHRTKAFRASGRLVSHAQNMRTAVNMAVGMVGTAHTNWM